MPDLLSKATLNLLADSYSMKYLLIWHTKNKFWNSTTDIRSHYFSLLFFNFFIYLAVKWILKILCYRSFPGGENYAMIPSKKFSK